MSNKEPGDVLVPEFKWLIVGVCVGRDNDLCVDPLGGPLHIDDLPSYPNESEVPMILTPLEDYQELLIQIGREDLAEYVGREAKS